MLVLHSFVHLTELLTSVFSNLASLEAFNSRHCPTTMLSLRSRHRVGRTIPNGSKGKTLGSGVQLCASGAESDFLRGTRGTHAQSNVKHGGGRDSKPRKPGQDKTRFVRGCDSTQRCRAPPRAFPSGHRGKSASQSLHPFQKNQTDLDFTWSPSRLCSKTLWGQICS